MCVNARIGADMRKGKKDKGTVQHTGQPAAVPQKSFGERLRKDFKGNWTLYLMVLIPLAYLIIFCYKPMGLSLIHI